MRRFFCSKENISADKIIVTDKKEVHHILSVMRHKIGDSINIFDGQGNEYDGKITKISDDKVIISFSHKDKSRSKRLHLTLACAIPKKSKFDQIIEKCTELGVDKIIPIVTERTIVNLDEKQRSLKLSRWQRVAISACKQSGRKNLTEIQEVKDFKVLIKEVKSYDLAIFLCLQEKRKDIKGVLGKFQGKSAIVFIGPEGDFTQEEINEAKRNGCQFASLGKNTLRVETAAVFVASIFNYIFDLNG